MPSIDAPSVQSVLMTFTEEAISNSKIHSTTLKYQCTDAFYLTIGSTGVEGTFAQNLLELLCILPEQFSIAPTLISIALVQLVLLAFSALDPRSNFQCID
jgi:hypothetical protein